MDYKTRLAVAYWVLLAVMILLVWFIAGLAFTILWLRRRRFARVHQAYLARVEKRHLRAMEDATWFLLRSREARLAEQIADAKAVVRVVRDARDNRLSLVTDEAV